MSSYPEKPYLKLANGMYITSDPTGTRLTVFSNTGTALLIVDQSGAGSISLPQKVGSINSVSTFGLGVPAIYASARSLAQTGAVASVASFTPGADGTLIVSANVLVTTSTTHSFTVTCAYTDEGNTARTLTMAFLLVAGSAITNTIANAAGAVPYMGIPVEIRAKGGTAVTIATTGTFTTVTYNVEGLIMQVA
jgi:hypothetical protein